LLLEKPKDATTEKSRLNWNSKKQRQGFCPNQGFGKNLTKFGGVDGNKAYSSVIIGEIDFDKTVSYTHHTNF
jgi:hypothetical protein